MARIPEPPVLYERGSLIGFITERVISIILGTWIIFQIIGLFFYSVFHFSSVNFREFMFREFIVYWEKWGTYIMTELTPSFFQWIWTLPTWKDPIGWVLVTVVIYRFLKRFKKEPTLNQH